MYAQLGHHRVATTLLFGLKQVMSVGNLHEQLTVFL
jgi:hypothetical protein